MAVQADGSGRKDSKRAADAAAAADQEPAKKKQKKASRMSLAAEASMEPRAALSPTETLLEQVQPPRSIEDADYVPAQPRWRGGFSAEELQGKELWLLQLPTNWDFDAHMSWDMRPDSQDGVIGSAADLHGVNYSIVDEHEALSAPVYAACGTHTVPFVRRVTLLRQHKTLDAKLEPPAALQPTAEPSRAAARVPEQGLFSKSSTKSKTKKQKHKDKDKERDREQKHKQKDKERDRDQPAEAAVVMPASKAAPAASHAATPAAVEVQTGTAPKTEKHRAQKEKAHKHRKEKRKAGDAT